MISVTLVLLGLACVFAFMRWKRGLMLCVLTALIQDPLRKLTPGEPVVFVVLVGVVFAAAWIGASLVRVPLKPRVIYGWPGKLSVPFGCVMFVVAAQAVHSYIVYDSAIMTAIGLLSYLAPLPAIVFGYQFALRSGSHGVRKWMWFYAVVAGVWLSGVYLEYAGAGWDVLGEVGSGIIIYDVGTVLKGHAGFFRASEIAAWHTATIASFAFILLMGRRLSPPRLLLVLLCIAFLVGLGLLTGRRKVIIQIAIFVSAYFFLVAWFGKGAAKMAAVAALAGFASYVVIVGIMAPDPGEKVFASKKMRVEADETYTAYALRGRSVVEDVGERFRDLGIGPVMWAVDSFGIFGAGLGTGSQGVQHFIRGKVPDRGAAEGGLGKITMELGLPGLILALWLVVVFSRHVWHVLRYLSRASPPHAAFAYGMVGFLFANVATFSVATQAFGDVFILLCIGWTTGFLLAMPVLVQRGESILPQHNVVRITVPSRQPLPRADAPA